MPGEPLPVSAFAILGLLSKAPASGYQLAQEVDGAISNFWPMSKSNVYGELVRLEGLGFIAGSDVSQAKLPNKRVSSSPPQAARRSTHGCETRASGRKDVRTR
jgi:DNA-binding PadR family transcriptional regulator